MGAGSWSRAVSDNTIFLGGTILVCKNRHHAMGFRRGCYRHRRVLDIGVYLVVIGLILEILRSSAQRLIATVRSGT